MNNLPKVVAGLEPATLRSQVRRPTTPPYSDATQLNSTDLLRADWLYAATGSVALPIVADS